MNIAPYRKAILAYVLPFLGALGATMSDGSLTIPEAVAAIGVGLVTGTAVYATANGE